MSFLMRRSGKSASDDGKRLDRQVQDSTNEDIVVGMSVACPSGYCVFLIDEQCFFRRQALYQDAESRRGSVLTFLIGICKSDWLLEVA